MTTLVVRSFGRIARPLGAVFVILCGFQIALILMAAEFAADGNFERLSQLVPSVLEPAIAPALISFDRMVTIGYFDVLIVMLVVQWAVYVATEPAGEIEAGLIDFVLARPIARHRLVTRSLLVMTSSTLVLTLGMLAGTLLGLTLFAPHDTVWPATRILVLMVAHLTLIGWCFGAAGLAAAGWARRRGAAIATVAIAAIALYLIDFLGLWWAPIETMARFTPFNYFHGGPLLAGTDDPVLNLTVLASLTAAGSVIAYARFQTRDL